MPKRTDIERDEANRFPHAAEELSASSQPPHRTSQVIPFPRDRSASGLANEGTEAASVPSPFIPLGSATAAVVMRLSKQFPRIKVLVADTGREGDIRDES